MSSTLSRRTLARTLLPSIGTSDSTRKPCAMVMPKGPSLARSGSTWIHWWSPVASANRFTCVWSTACHSLDPRCSPTASWRSAGDAKTLMALLSWARGPSVHHATAADRLGLMAARDECDSKDYWTSSGRVHMLTDHAYLPAAVRPTLEGAIMRQRRRLGLLAAIVAALVIAGCGGGSSTGSQAGNGSGGNVT